MSFDALPHAVLWGFWAVVGLFIGSFLNVAIHRLPLEHETVNKPARSRCPSCKTTLTWQENVPLVSWLAQRGRCRTCGWRIPWRYPLVELLTAALWFVVARHTLPHAIALCATYSLVLSALVVATFVDFDCFEIPDEISIGGMCIAPVASCFVPALHDATWIAERISGPGAAHVTRIGALTGCVAGMAVGGGLLWLVGWVGSRVYGRDAMGFGDVKLLAAGGGFIGPGGALAALMIASLVASLAGIANMLRFYVLVRARARSRRTHKSVRRALHTARVAGRYLPFGPYLALGIGIVLLYWNDVIALLP